MGNEHGQSSSTDIPPSCNISHEFESDNSASSMHAAEGSSAVSAAPPAAAPGDVVREGSAPNSGERTCLATLCLGSWLAIGPKLWQHGERRLGAFVEDGKEYWYDPKSGQVKEEDFGLETNRRQSVWKGVESRAAPLVGMFVHSASNCHKKNFYAVYKDGTVVKKQWGKDDVLATEKWEGFDCSDGVNVVFLWNNEFYKIYGDGTVTQQTFGSSRMGPRQRWFRQPVRVLEHSDFGTVHEPSDLESVHAAFVWENTFYVYKDFPNLVWE